MEETRYETVPHTADLAVVVFGSTLEGLFANSGFALFDVMVSWQDLPETEVAVEVSAPSLEDLMVAWLSELLYMAETRRLAFRRFQVEEVGEKLRAVVRGVDLDQLELRGPPVKAITYHQLAIEQGHDGWRASLVFDV